MALDIISTTTGKKLNVSKNGRRNKTKSDEDKRREARKKAKAQAKVKAELKSKEPKLKKGGAVKRARGGTAKKK